MFILWESVVDRKWHAAIFEEKMSKMTERVTAESRDWSAEQFFDSLESVALAVEGSALGTSEVPFF